MKGQGQYKLTKRPIIIVTIGENVSYVDYGERGVAEGETPTERDNLILKKLL